jgi:hypothetical protein
MDEAPPHTRQVFDLASLTRSDEHRQIFHEGRDLVLTAHDAVANTDASVVDVLGSGAFSLCFLCQTGETLSVLKVGALPEMVAAEIAALHVWRPTGLLPMPLHYDLDADVALAMTTSSLWTSFVPGLPLASRITLTPAEVYRLTDAVCDAWRGWQISVIDPVPAAVIGTLDTTYARRVLWARRRCERESQLRPYCDNLDGLVERVINLSAEVPSALCHGDLSPRNLLVEATSTEERVHVIDPAPSIGDPLADLAHWAVNCHADVSGRLTEEVLVRLISRAGVDGARLRAWAEIAAVTESNLAQLPNNPATGWLQHFHFA